MFVSISGSKSRDPSICEVAYKDKIETKSVHFIGAKDWLRLPSEELANAFHDPLIIRHPQGHTVPGLDGTSTEQLRKWIADILVPNKGDICNGEHDEMRSVEETMKVDDEERKHIINKNSTDATEFEKNEVKEETPKQNINSMDSSEFGMNEVNT
ncbi:hypothetical protein F3Y22_tig00110457pilonHSYRG00013 [Hibiscus syriacus]|uniref:Serine hydrolase domain-containing protein n=1 Tax=Hibiscus syriacus TaxID=106335 RepID=A0A6A3ANF2_HIBSY|nr:hypothetical protein F3Y22_tig00110457pilonHSYRG00013 [Hibiscus syriacus]